MIKIQGHRGFPDLYPENTMISFIKTMEAGADAAEMDVRVTADEEYIILHDETLDRTTDGTGNAKFVNYNGYIDTLDAGAWFGSEFVGTKVPRLEDVLSYFKGKDFKLVLQLYFTGASRVQNIRDVLDKVIAHGMINKVYIFAPPDDINEVKSYNSSFFTMNSGMATINTFQDILDNAVTYGHNAVSITNNASDVDLATMISAIKAAGKEVHVSYLTSNYQTRVQRYIDAGADYILGNDPGAMQAYVDTNYPTVPEEPETPPIEPNVSAEYLLNSDYTIKKTAGRLKAVLFTIKNSHLLKLNIRQALGEKIDDIRIENPITNLITNGDFSESIFGWSISGGTLSTVDNTGIIAMTDTGNLKQLLGNPVTGDRYYAKLTITPRIVLNRIDLVLRGSTSINVGFQTFQAVTTPTPNVPHILSGIATVQDTHAGQVETVFRFYIEGSQTGNIEVQYFTVINLTKTFGVGKEPTKAEMDALMSKYPNSWFDGTTEIL